MRTSIENQQIIVPIYSQSTNKKYIKVRMSSYYVSISNMVEVHIKLKDHMGAIICERHMGDLYTDLYKAILDVRDRLSNAVSELADALASQGITFKPARLTIDRAGAIGYNRRGLTSIRKKI